MKASARGLIRGKQKGHSIVETVFMRSLLVYMLNSLAWALGALMDGIVIGNHLGVADTVWTLSSFYYGEEDRKALDELQYTAYRSGSILVKNDELILRMRDDCRPFNLPERYAMTVRQGDDPSKNVGIRMVMNMSRDVQYLSTMSTNNLIVRI